MILLPACDKSGGYFVAYTFLHHPGFGVEWSIKTKNRHDYYRTVFVLGYQDSNLE